MMARIGKAVLLALAATLALPLAAFAADGSDTQAARVAGEITAVDPAADVFVLHSRRGEDLRIHVDGDTQFHSRTGEIDGLEDLKPGMHAVVAVERLEDGALLGKHVAVAAPPPDRPPAEAHAAGRIVGLGGASITLERRDGSRQTFAVNRSTIYKSRDGSVDSYDDLEVGMPAAIGAKEDGGGLVAIWVAVGEPPGDRPRDRFRERLEDRLRHHLRHRLRERWQDRQEESGPPGEGV